MMDGAWNAKTLVTEYLAQDVPSRILSFRNYWKLDSGRLPTPLKWYQYEPLVLDSWPTVITLVTGTTNVQRDDYDIHNADPKYEVTYSMRTYVWARSVGPGELTQMRDNLTTVIRDALIDNPSLRSVNGYQNCYPHIDEASVREEFSDLTLAKGERYIGGSFIGYNMKVTETVTAEPLSDVPMLAYTVTGELMPKTANAPSILIAAAGNTEAILTWKAPTWDGGADPIDSYKIEQTLDGGTTWSTVVADTGSIDPIYTVTGLTNGDEYCFRVSAINSFGVGAASAASNPITPST